MASNRRKAYTSWKAATLYKQRRTASRLSPAPRHVTKIEDTAMTWFEQVYKLLAQNVVIDIRLTIGVKPDETARIVYPARCECGWYREYDTPMSADRGLKAHKQHCSWIADADEHWMNGDKNE